MRILMTAMMFLAASASLILQAPSAWSVMQSSDAAISGLPEREELLYKVKWLGIPVGMAIARINGIKTINGRRAYELVITVRTNSFCSRIYKIEDKYVSYLDKEKFCTVRHEVYRREGRYRKDAVTDFDQINHKAYFKNFLDKSEKTITIPSNVQDPVSMIYYFRLIPLGVGWTGEYSVYNNESVYNIRGLIEKRTFISVPHAGKKEAFCIQPYAKLKGETVKKGRARGYIGCYGKRIPLIGVVKGPIFTEVVAYLVKE